MKLLTIFLVFLFVGCTRMNVEGTAPTKPSSGPPEVSLVFIQGYHLDEESWDKVRARIPTDKYHTLSLGRIGRDDSKPASLRNIATKHCQEISANSILVAHSYGGAIANAMFGICTQKILKIIYVSAIVPNSDEKPFARMTNEKEQANYANAVTFDAKMITPKDAKTFYDVMDPDVDLNSPTLPKVYPESMSLTTEELRFNPEKFKLLPKAYIVTNQDHIVSVSTQQMFIKDAEITKVEEIATGHLPMISKPALLADLILKLAK